MPKHLISMSDLSKEEILKTLDLAREFKTNPPKPLLQGKILASCFFEPSTRTRLSFETAMLRLGGHVIGFADGLSTSVKKGESLADSIRTIGQYADILIVRHPMDGAARLASLSTDKPVINAGDGTNQHPTQTLIDLFSILETQGRLEKLRIAIMGDLKHARTGHSIALGAALFDMQIYFVSSEELSPPESVCHGLRKKGIKFSFHRGLEEIISKIDILYVTRLQKERIGKEYEEYSLRPSILEKAKPNLKILHPLPRIEEIHTSIDTTPFAYYFQQAANGIPIRQALLTEILTHG